MANLLGLEITQIRVDCGENIPQHPRVINVSHRGVLHHAKGVEAQAVIIDVADFGVTDSGGQSLLYILVEGEDDGRDPVRLDGVRDLIQR